MARPRANSVHSPRLNLGRPDLDREGTRQTVDLEFVAACWASFSPSKQVWTCRDFEPWPNTRPNTDRSV
jgi:hypothetical protein